MQVNEFGLYPIEDWSGTQENTVLTRLMNETDIDAAVKDKDERYLKFDDSSVMFGDELAVKEYLLFRKQHDTIMKLFPGDLTVIGIDPDSPITNDQVRISANLSNSDAPDTVLNEAAASNGLLLVHPNEEGTRYVVHPFMYTAISGLCARAEISGKAILRTIPATGKRVLGGPRRGQIFTDCLHLSDAMINVLVRDGKICRMASAKYEDLDPAEGFYALKDYLADVYPASTFAGGGVSEEYLTVLYDTHTDTTDILLKLNGFGMKAKEANMLVRYSTSEVRASAMRVTPVLEIDGISIPIGKPIEMTHETGNSVEKLKNKLPSLAYMMQEAEDAIEELGNTQIDSVADCLMNIQKEFRELRKDFVKVECDKWVPLSGNTGIDVIMALNNVIAQQCASNSFNVTEFIRLSEIAASYITRDLTKFDHPVDD